MSYEKYYPGGWQSGESGGTPITPEALNHMESGIANSAPAGYGLGGYSQEISGKDIDTITVGGCYWWRTATNTPFDWGYMIVTPANGNSYCTQTIYKMVEACVVRRTKTDAGWVTEWVNPPMALGVEYRTTERYNGKPVYAMLLNCGVAATGSVSVKYSDGTNIPVTHLVEEHYSVQAGKNYMQGVFSNNNITAYFSKGPNPIIKITTNVSDFADNGYILYATLKYTKD